MPNSMPNSLFNISTLYYFLLLLLLLTLILLNRYSLFLNTLNSIFFD